MYYSSKWYGMSFASGIRMFLASFEEKCLVSQLEALVYLGEGQRGDRNAKDLRSAVLGNDDELVH